MLSFDEKEGFEKFYLDDFISFDDSLVEKRFVIDEE